MARRILNAAPIPPIKPDAAKRTNPAHNSTTGCVPPTTSADLCESDKKPPYVGWFLSLAEL